MKDSTKPWLVFGDSHVNAFVRAQTALEERLERPVRVDNFAPGRLIRSIVSPDGELSDTLRYSPNFQDLIANRFGRAIFCFGSNEAVRYQFSAWTKEVILPDRKRGTITEEMLRQFFESSALDVLKAMKILQERYDVSGIKFLWCPPPLSSPRRIISKMRFAKGKKVKVAASSEIRWFLWSTMVSVFEDVLPADLIAPDDLRYDWLPEELSLDGIHGNEKWAEHCLNLFLGEEESV